MFRVVDLRSDTLSKPTAEMRKAMSEAEVGDDVFKEDPTVNELESYMSNVLNKESALFMPSGTMANLAAVMAHCWQRGAEILLGDQTHLHLNEQAIAFVHSRPLVNKSDGTFCIEEMKRKIRTSYDQHFPVTALICLENTHNVCNGSALPLEFIDQVTSIARSHSIPVHMDGARLFNASIITGESVSRIVRDCDSVSICLSKGLGSPVGTVLAGSHQFIQRALRCRKVLGGGMRQSGILAAAGLWALKNNVERLRDDHKHTAMIAHAITDKKSEWIRVDLDHIHSNIGYIEVNPSFITAPDFATRLQKVSEEEKDKFGERCVVVRIGPKSQSRLRFVTHLNLNTEDIQRVIEKINFIIDNEFK